MLETVESLQANYGYYFNIAEWIITVLFTIEYVLRVWTIKKPSAYIFSFYGIIDFLSTIPKYISLLFAGANILIALRALRLLRVFRILKLSPFVGESQGLKKSLQASKAKISVFLLAVLILTIILGTIMYMVEYKHDSGFNNIPKSMYWAIVTLTTVGYGDIAPVTALGQFIASIIMILGYGILAVPTGIVSAEYTKQIQKKVHHNTQVCPNCHATGHLDNAQFCYKCGKKLN
jgi:voltage-gated potassium channel